MRVSMLGASLCILYVHITYCQQDRYLKKNNKVGNKIHFTVNIIIFKIYYTTGADPDIHQEGGN